MIQAIFIFVLVLLFVISTIFTLIFITSIDDEVISNRLRTLLLFPLYFGFTYIIASLSYNAMGLIMMAYIPAVIATLFDQPRTAIVVSFFNPLIDALYLRSEFPELSLSTYIIPILLSWLALSVLIVIFYKFGKSKTFYVLVALGFGLLENMQASFYTVYSNHLLLLMVVNVLCYGMILWLALHLKERLDQFQNRLSDELMRDPLTNVFNLKSFNEGKANTPVDNPYVIAVLDIDEFKSLNDTLGHSAGNTIIKQMANTLLDILDPEREEEAVRIFRFGGEEFVVVELTDKDLDEAMLDLQSALNQANQEFNDEIKKQFNRSVSFSGGITSSRSHDQGYTSFRKADALLYQMKKSTPGVIAVDIENADE